MCAPHLYARTASHALYSQLAFLCKSRGLSQGLVFHEWEFNLSKAGRDRTPLVPKGGSECRH